MNVMKGHISAMKGQFTFFFKSNPFDCTILVCCAFLLYIMGEGFFSAFSLGTL
jgi:hypothetical protein